jgi:hypothetical protein
LDDSDKDIVTAAVQTCGIMQVPGWHARIMKLLDRPDLADGGRVLYWLSKGPLSRELLEKAKVIFKSPERRGPGDWDVSLFEAFARDVDPELRQAGREELIGWLRSSGGLELNSYRGDRLGVLETLAKTSRENDVEWLRTAVDAERGLYARSLLVALIRIEGNDGKTRLLRLLGDPNRQDVAIIAAGEVFAGTGDTDVVGALGSVAPSAAERTVDSICSALWSVGGDAAKQLLRELIPRLSTLHRAVFVNRLDERPKDLLKRRVIDSGILDAAAFDTAVQKAGSMKSPRDAGPLGLLDVLYAADMVVQFDVETDMLPCRHDQLVAQFARHSRGVFAPTAVSEEWHRRHAEDFDADYTLRFVVGDRLYEGRMRNLGDWYDVARVISMINRALRDSGNPEEFIGLATADQVASFVFCNRRTTEALAAEFEVPLSDDLDEARRAGVEFERKVIENSR